MLDSRAVRQARCARHGKGPQTNTDTVDLLERLRVNDDGSLGKRLAGTSLKDAAGHVLDACTHHAHATSESFLAPLPPRTAGGARRGALVEAGASREERTILDERVRLGQELRRRCRVVGDDADRRDQGHGNYRQRRADLPYRWPSHSVMRKDNRFPI